MQLKEYCNDDMWLVEALECDHVVMRDLGGPISRERIEEIHKRRLRGVISKAYWYFTIHPDDTSGAVGTIGIWESEWEGARINEMGWMILPAFQGRGIASQAGRIILDRALNERKYREVVAFPSVQNAASNAICRKLGFELLKEVEAAYNGPPQASNLWKVELWSEE